MARSFAATVFSLVAWLLVGVCPLRADETFAVKDVGVSITFPDGWRHDDTDHFGFLIHPPGDVRQKVRIHLTGHKGQTLEEAILKASEKVNGDKKNSNRPPEKILHSEPVVTKSGIPGRVASIAPDARDSTPYLDRYYFLKPDGDIFCVCVYLYDDPEFGKRCRGLILDTLTLTQ